MNEKENIEPSGPEKTIEEILNIAIAAERKKEREKRKAEQEIIDNKLIENISEDDVNNIKIEMEKINKEKRRKQIEKGKIAAIELQKVFDQKSVELTNYTTLKNKNDEKLKKLLLDSSEKQIKVNHAEKDIADILAAEKEDEAQGSDILMVKPALAYLKILRDIDKNTKRLTEKLDKFKKEYNILVSKYSILNKENNIIISDIKSLTSNLLEIIQDLNNIRSY